MRFELKLDKECQEILREIVNKSHWVREAIKYYANNKLVTYPPAMPYNPQAQQETLQDTNINKKKSLERVILEKKLKSMKASAIHDMVKAMNLPAARKSKLEHIEDILEATDV